MTLPFLIYLSIYIKIIFALVVMLEKSIVECIYAMPSIISS